MHGTQGEIARIISIHAPPRGATCIVAGRSCTKPDFNSRPSARGDKACLLACLLASLISIHAPPRGATLLRGGLLRGGLISIHAPPRGATAAAPRLRAEANYFNSRPSARGDRKADADALAADLFQFTPLREGRRFRLSGRLHLVISIHAPPRGATRRYHRVCQGVQHFNSRPSARGDLPTCRFLHPEIHFNSRPSARGDVIAGVFAQMVNHISIHAPPRGATGRKCLKTR